ncbi:MAG TPA: LytTR family DNA-binding domain-containing protein [Acidobacteriota bacterium]|nr:LytTR family DNA-binding domain-containing protein [Acidobacteriota bacterium]HMZ79402.1 LytTR family DNA-binding domain-containing protein [Acidobacteriota bacterium]HNB70067.1 LytTR family DNA-binding domain-containing protein [Acidobacteriota bacterium]HND21094.1 LytTR family DNA-binding domain-containing protein [Acidobacteriota bacterium]HNG92277.1 LytTR family DNA-binding domain-containing protein [Acidobacteriota bacterium]
MKKIQTVIVDDMPLARQKLVRFLNDDPEIEIVAECGNGLEAIDAIISLKPELVFLDIQMPEVDGFEVLNHIGLDHMPAFIFVTAFDHFALKAFEVNALDYLLKPYDRERFVQALNRAKKQLQRTEPEPQDERLLALLKTLNPEQKFLKRLAVKTSGRTIFLMVDEIDWIETAGNYLELHVGKEVHLIRERMNQIESRLDPTRFVRIHRTTIVNLDRIKELQPLFNGDQTVILRNGNQLTLSRTYRDRLLALMEEG